MKYYKLGGEEVRLEVDSYAYTGNTAINAVCSSGEPYCTLTVNLCELDSKDLTYLNVNLFGIDVEKFITDNNLGEKVKGMERQSGYLTYPLYRLKLKKLCGE